MSATVWSFIPNKKGKKNALLRVVKYLENKIAEGLMTLNILISFLLIFSGLIT